MSSLACPIGLIPSLCTISWYRPPFFFESHHGSWKNAQRPKLCCSHSKVLALEQLLCIRVLHSPSDALMYKSWGVYFSAMKFDLYNGIFGNCNHLPIGRPPGGSIGYHLPTGRPPGCTIKQHPPPGRPPGCPSQNPVRVSLRPQQFLSLCVFYISDFELWGAMQACNLSSVMIPCQRPYYSLWGVQWILHLYGLWGAQSFISTSLDILYSVLFLLVRYFDFYLRALWGAINQVTHLMIIPQHETARSVPFLPTHHQPMGSHHSDCYLDYYPTTQCSLLFWIISFL